jgi:NTE family protein
VAFSKGPLLEAVGASIAIPGLIAGPVINGDLYVDGGVVNPVPFDHVRSGMDFVVAIDVTGIPKSSRGTKTLSNMDVGIGSLMLMFAEIAKLRRAINPPDIYITPPLDGLGSADFFNVKGLLAAGDSCKDDLKRKLEMRLG